MPSPIGLRFTREFKRKHVTLTMLWDEYIERCPEGYRYSRFCELYRGWASRLSVTMRQAHIGGDKLFVDYAGDTVPVIVDRLTGQVRPAQIFVAVMGASNFTYAEASWTQALADWIGAHTRAFAALGGVPKLLVPDNTKSLPSRKRGSLSSKPASTSRRSIEPQPPLGQALCRDGLPLRYRDPALSRQRERARIESLQFGAGHAAATAACHSAAASARKIRSVDREMRWRWRLKVLWTAACMLRKRWADRADLNRCSLRSRRRTA